MGDLSGGGSFGNITGFDSHRGYNQQVAATACCAQWSQQAQAPAHQSGHMRRLAAETQQNPRGGQASQCAAPVRHVGTSCRGGLNSEAGLSLC
jgi:hypothetical protein